MNWYLKVLNNYANFSGRARRKEYWMFFLFNVLFGIVTVILDNMLGLAMPETGYGAIYLIYSLAIIIPSIAVGVRRLHDIGKSGFWLFIAFIPIVGGIWLLVLFATEGKSGDNEYGSDPKAEEGTFAV